MSFPIDLLSTVEPPNPGHPTIHLGTHFFVVFIMKCVGKGDNQIWNDNVLPISF